MISRTYIDDKINQIVEDGRVAPSILFLSKDLYREMLHMCADGSNYDAGYRCVTYYHAHGSMEIKCVNVEEDLCLFGDIYSLGVYITNRMLLGEINEQDTDMWRQAFKGYPFRAI